MNIAIIGTRGIPNDYGGFEQFAEHLAVGIAEMGNQVTVYNSHKHPYQVKVYKGVNIVHCFDPEFLIGTAGQFIYDLNCILDTRKKGFDVILQLGYTSSSVWAGFLPRKGTRIITNMDGLEWKRTKYSSPVQKFLCYAEELAVKHSDFLIADSIGIQEYIKEKYQKNSTYIPYGAEPFDQPNQSIINKYNLVHYEYNMLIARLEPENSIEIILNGHILSGTSTPFLVIGKHDTKFGKYLKEKFKNSKDIIFAGGIYNINDLNNLRYFSNLYFHGHTVGGTNPSLLEAMASNGLICAHNNIFNRSILENEAFYFNTAEDVSQIIIQRKKPEFQLYLQTNLLKIKEKYKWKDINDSYLKLFILATGL